MNNEQFIRTCKRIMIKENLNEKELADKLGITFGYFYSIYNNKNVVSNALEIKLDILCKTNINPNLLTFGNKLRYLRLKNNLSLYRLSKITGISSMHLGRLERGITKNITNATKIKLEKALNIKIVLDIKI